MKKMIRILTVALLCLMMALPASAAAPMLYRDNIEYTRFVLGTNLLRIDGNQGEALADINGNMLTGQMYDSLYYENGYITGAQTTVGGINCYGALDVTGKVVVPFQYNIVKVKGNWAVGIALVEATSDAYDYSNYAGDAFFNIQNVDFYRLPEGAKVGGMTREQYLDYNVVNDCINVQDRATGAITTYDAAFTALGNVDDLYDTDYAPAAYTTYRENGQYGIKDSAGNIVMAPSYQTVYDYRYGYFVVSTGDNEGLVDANGQLVIPAEYEDIKYMYNQPMTANGNYSYKALDTYYCIVKDGKVGYITDNNTVTYAPRYSKDIVEVNGASMTLTDLEGNTILIAADGVETILPAYERMNVLDYSSGVYYRVSENGKYGVIDWHGEVVLPSEYDSVQLSGDGQYLLVSKDYSTYSIYQLTYPTAGAPAAETAPAETTEAAAEETAGESERPQLGKGKLNKDKGEESAETAPEAEQAPAAADNNAALTLLNSAVTLLTTDAAANGASAVSLLNSAAALVGNAEAANLLSSAATLLSTDAAANAATATTLIQSAITLIK